MIILPKQFDGEFHTEYSIDYDDKSNRFYTSEYTVPWTKDDSIQYIDNYTMGASSFKSHAHAKELLVDYIRREISQLNKVLESINDLDV